MSDPVQARRSGLLALLAAFALGLITGAALLRLWDTGREARPAATVVLQGPGGRITEEREAAIAHLQRLLDLDPEQTAEIRGVLEDWIDGSHAQKNATRERIRGVLTPDQRERFDAMRPPPPPPPPPPPTPPTPPPPEESRI